MDFLDMDHRDYQCQLLFNSIQNFKQSLKIIDMRPREQYNSNHLINSVHFDPRSEISSRTIQQKVLGGSTSINRLRRYFIVVGTDRQYRLFAEQFVTVLKQAKCREWIISDEYSAFLQKYPFLLGLQLDRISFPNLIIPRLFLGDSKHAQSSEVIQRLKITHIINATKTVPSLFKDRVQYLNLSIQDSDDTQIQFHFRQAAKFLDRALMEEESVVLVHCAQGVSRSATFVIMYLMDSFDLNDQEAYQHVKNQRIQVQPNEGFRQKLVEFQKNHKLFVRPATVVFRRSFIDAFLENELN